MHGNEGAERAWKGFDWETMNRLYEKGYISDPRSKAKSVAMPLDKKRTKITMYRPSRGNDAMVKAIKGWAAGDNAGCPDLTK
jgi:hypothetical protein